MVPTGLDRDKTARMREMKNNIISYLKKTIHADRSEH